MDTKNRYEITQEEYEKAKEIVKILGKKVYALKPTQWGAFSGLDSIEDAIYDVLMDNTPFKKQALAKAKENALEIYSKVNYLYQNKYISWDFTKELLDMIVALEVIVDKKPGEDDDDFEYAEDYDEEDEGDDNADAWEPPATINYYDDNYAEERMENYANY